MLSIPIVLIALRGIESGLGLGMKNLAVYTGWSCPSGPASFVWYLVDQDHSEELEYAEFAEEVNLSTAPLDDTQFEVLPTDWAVTFLRTHLPSGELAWVMQHGGIEHLFLKPCYELDLEYEARLAEIWDNNR